VNINYPVAIEPGNQTTAWGVVVPDLPGCFSAADSGLDEALENAKQAITLWIEEAIAHDEMIPPPSRLETLQSKKQFSGWIWAVVSVDSIWVDQQSERINITLPRQILALLDSKARRCGESRSGYIAQLALQAQAP